MNKFKKILLGTLSVLTLGLFVVTGTKVNAATANRTFEFDMTSLKDLAASSNQDVSSTDSGTNTTMKVNFTNGGTAAMAKSGSGSTGYLTLAASATYTLSITTGEAGTLTMKLDTRGTAANKVLTLKQYHTSIAESNLDSTTSVSTSNGGNSYPFNLSANTTYYFTYDVTSSTRFNNYLVYTDTYTSSETYKATFDLNSGTYNSESTYTDNNEYELNDVLTLPTAANMIREGYVFNGWETSLDETISKTTTTYSMKDNVTFTAIWKSASLSYKIDGSNIDATETKLTAALEDAYDSIFTLNIDLLPAADTAYNLPDGNKSTKKINTSGSSFNGTKIRTIDFTAPSDGVITIWWWGSETSRYLRVLKGDATAIDDSTVLKTGTMTSENISSKNAQILTMSVTNGTSYRIGSTSAINIFKVEFIQKSVQVIQQEVPNQIIGEDDATYIRFVAIVKGVEDINSSDFTFKIYREKGGATQSITRTVSTYNVLKSSGATYVAAIPGEASHTFDGACETEFYALFVIGLTDATYKGYTVYAGFTYGGTEYPTTGYTFN